MEVAMYHEKLIEEKCHELNPELKKAGLLVTAIYDPIKVGYTIAVSENTKEEPAMKELFLDHIVAEACFKNDNCDGWKNILSELGAAIHLR
jgi:hypothetical protein